MNSFVISPIFIKTRNCINFLQITVISTIIKITPPYYFGKHKSKINKVVKKSKITTKL